MWHGLIGSLGSASNNTAVGSTVPVAGTITVPAGATIVHIYAHSAVGGTFQVFGGTTYTVPAGYWWARDWMHSLLNSKNNNTTSGSQNIVFTNCDSYDVEWVVSGNV